MKNQVKAKISTKRLVELAQEDMKLPKDAKACYHYREEWTDSLVIMFEHESFAATPEEDLIPIWEPPTTKYKEATTACGVRTFSMAELKAMFGNTIPTPPKVEDPPPKKKKWREFL